MARWFRWSDIFALIGVVLLVATTPAYVAQSETEEDIAGGREFNLPMPRMGMSMEREVIFRYEGETYAVGPIERTTVREPRPGEAPVDALYVVDIESLPVHAEFGWATFDVTPGVQRFFFSEEGLPILEKEEAFYHEGGQWIWQESETRIYDLTFQRFWSRNAGTLLTYEPMPFAVALAELGDGLKGEMQGNAAASTWRNIYTDMAASHRGLLLFGNEYDFPFNNAKEITVCTSCSTHPSELRGLALAGYGEDGYAFDGGLEWYSDRWPGDVGASYYGYDKATNKSFLEAHVLPRSIEPGRGDALPLVRESIPWERIPSYGLPRPSSDLPKMTLLELQSNTADLYGSVSVDDLRAALQDEAAPESIRSFAPRALVTDFAWFSEPVETDLVPPPEGGPVPLPGPLADPPDPTEVRRAAWIVVLTAADGARRAAEIQLVDRGGSLSVERIRDVCDDEPTVGRVSCVSSSHPLAGAKLVPEPIAAIAHADKEAHRMAPPADPARAPFTSFAYSMSARTWIGPEYNDPEREMPLALPAMHHHSVLTGEPGTPVQDGVLWWDDDLDASARLYGSAEMMDGSLPHIVYRETREPSQGDALAPSTEDASVMRPLSGIAAGTVAGGAFLVLISVVVRALAAVKAAGLPAPLIGLYAKLSQADVLLHQRRQEIVAYLGAEPGATRHEVGQALGYGWGATVHHLETLRRNGVLIATELHGHRHYFPAGLKAGANERRLLAARRSGPTAALLDAVVARPGANLKELAEAVGTKSSAASRIAARLAKEGLVERKRDGMAVRFYPTVPAAQAAA